MKTAGFDLSAVCVSVDKRDCSPMACRQVPADKLKYTPGSQIITERRTLPPNADTDDVFGATLNLMLSSFRGDNAIYMPVEVIGMKFYGMLGSGASHVIVNHEGCRKLKALRLELRESATTSCALADK
ncbi:hypothetical protein MTP99_005984 [Tenebrio molitor]|jgi:hypothetical protein|nr:hypothetical protein MTP99_005984 [Tenebrio molitor]